MNKKEAIKGYLLILPAIVLLCIFTIYSFKNYLCRFIF